MTRMTSSEKSEPRTRSPTCFARVVTTPSMGDTSVVSERKWRASRSAASAWSMRPCAASARACPAETSERACSSSAALALPPPASRSTRASSCSSRITCTFCSWRSAAALARAASCCDTWAA